MKLDVNPLEKYKLDDATIMEMYLSVDNPPGYPTGGMNVHESHIWIRFTSGPSGWFRSFYKSRIALKRKLEDIIKINNRLDCVDIIHACDMWLPEK